MNHNNELDYSLKTFLPLIIIFTSIIAFTVIKQLFATSWNITTIMADFMGAFFIVFGTFKVINLKQFASAYAMYDLIGSHSQLYCYLYPFIEITLGILYFLRWNPPVTNIITLIIMLISAAGVATELLKGKHIVCACLGAVFKIPMTYVTLFEDLLMAGMAAAMLFM